MALTFIQYLLENSRNKINLTRQNDDALILAIENNPYLAGGPMGDSWESWIEYVLDEYDATDAQIEATREYKFDPRRANANPEPRGYDYSQEEEESNIDMDNFAVQKRQQAARKQAAQGGNDMPQRSYNPTDPSSPSRRRRAQIDTRYSRKTGRDQKIQY